MLHVSMHTILRHARKHWLYSGSAIFLVTAIMATVLVVNLRSNTPTANHSGSIKVEPAARAADQTKSTTPSTPKTAVNDTPTQQQTSAGGTVKSPVPAAAKPAPAPGSLPTPKPVPVTSTVPAKRVTNVTITADLGNTTTGCWAAADYNYAYSFDFNYGAADAILSTRWEYEVLSGPANYRELHPLMDGYLVRASSVNIRHTAPYDWGFSSNSTTSYRFRLHVLSPNDVYSNWITVPKTNPCPL